MQADLQAELGKQNGCRLTCRLSSGKKMDAGWTAGINWEIKIQGGITQADFGDPGSEAGACMLDV